MSPQSSGKDRKSQGGIWKSPEFAARLRQERQRTGLNQKDFGSKNGVTLDSQNRYETGKNQPNAEYLATLAQNGIDVLYILTGERIGGDRLDPEAAALVSHYLSLPAHYRQMARSVIRTMTEEAGTVLVDPSALVPTAATVHEKKSPSATTNS